MLANSSRGIPALLVLLSFVTLLSSTSAQLITSVSGCGVNANNRTSQCTPSTLISISGRGFPGAARVNIDVSTSACASPRWVNSTLLTCRLPAVPSAGVKGEWLNVTAMWEIWTAQLLGVSYAALNFSSSSSSSSSSSTGAAIATSMRSVSPSSSSSSRQSSSSSSLRPLAISSSSRQSSFSSSLLRPLTTSSTSSPASSAPTILAVRGCINSGSQTLNCTYTSLITVVGRNFGSRAATVYFNRNVAAPSTYSANDTTIVCSVPTLQYVPYTLISVRVQTLNGLWSATFDGLSFTIIPPLVTGVSSGSQLGPNIRVSPGASITVTGSSFPTSGTVWVVLNRTAPGNGQMLSAEVLSSTRLVAALPLMLNSDLRRDVPAPLFVSTYHSISAPFMSVTVLSTPVVVPSSTGGPGPAPTPAPVITSLSGCEDDGQRTRSCLLYQTIPITIKGRDFPVNTPVTRVSIGSNTPPYALCTNVAQTVNTLYCNTPSSQSFMVNSPYQVWVFWSNGANATYYGIYFTDRLAPPTVDTLSGTGCAWNGTAALGCRRGNNAWLTVTGQHFPSYITPNVTVGGSSCYVRSGNRTSGRLVCRVTDTALPANVLLPLRVTFPDANTQSLDYNVLSFRASSTPPASSASDGTPLSLEDEIIVVLLTVTVVAVLVLAVIFGVTYLRLRRARTQQTSGDAWNEMVGGGGGGGRAGRGYRMGDGMDEPVVAAPYVPLVAQQLAVGGGDGEHESWEGIPSPR